MDSIQEFQRKLNQLESLLKRFRGHHARVRELKKNVAVLKALLKDQNNIKSPYGPPTAIVRFSLQ